MQAIRWLAGMVLAAAVSTMAAPTTFDFKDPKGVNSIQFILDSIEEPITGHAPGVRGTLTFDPSDPKATRGRLVVDADSLAFANPKMAEVLKSPAWLDAAANPEISFQIKDVAEAKPVAGRERTVHLRLKGDFRCKDVTKPIEVDVQATFLPGRLGDRLEGAKGDLLILRGEFSINRADYNIKPDLGFTSVANEIRIRVAIAGQAPAK